MLAEWKQLFTTRASHDKLVQSLIQRYGSLSAIERQAEVRGLCETLGFSKIPTINIDEAQPLSSALLARKSLRPPMNKLFQQISTQSEGVPFLIQLREDCLKQRRDSSEMQFMSDELKNFFTYWFTPGCLSFGRVDGSDPQTVQWLFEKETVQPADSLDDFYKRFENDRRIYGFWHPSFHLPLIFVQVALLNNIPASVPEIWAYQPSSTPPTTAVFYSINACMPGLRGVDLGGYLIKRAVRDICETTSVDTFCTLSPLPGLSKYVASHGDTKVAYQFAGKNEKFLQKYVANYLVNSRKCAVQNFHCRNGAFIGTIRLFADHGALRQKQSWGTMVNYIYKLEHLEENSTEYVKSGVVRALLETQKLAMNAKL